MSNNLQTFKKVTLDGKEYILKFDYNAACDLEEYFGKGIAGILNEEQVGFRLIRAFYWAGLKWKNPALTLDRIGQVLNKELTENEKSIQDLMSPVMEALQKSGLMGTKKTQDDFGEIEEPQDEEDLQTSEEDENPNV